MCTSHVPPVALFSAANVDDAQFGEVLARALHLPVLTHVASRARIATRRVRRSIACPDPLVAEASRRALYTMDALSNAAHVLAVAEWSAADTSVPRRWLTRLVVLRLERARADGPIAMLAGEARMRGPLAAAAAAQAARERLVSRAARSLAHHAMHACPTCTHPGFGGLDVCIGCGARARTRPQARNSDSRAPSWMASTAGCVSFRSTEMA